MERKMKSTNPSKKFIKVLKNSQSQTAIQLFLRRQPLPPPPARIKVNLECQLKNVLQILIGLDGGDMSANIELKERSSTLKSNFTDYDTPPETPEFRIDRLVG